MTEFLNRNSIDITHISNREVSQGCQITSAIASPIIREWGFVVEVGGHLRYLGCRIGQLCYEDTTLLNGWSKVGLRYIIYIAKMYELRLEQELK
jgi:hypothetical protein